MQKNKDLKTFGFIWAFIFLIISIYPLLKSEEIKLWSLAVSIFFLAFSLIKPTIFRRFHSIWIKVGEFIGGIISKVILFILYFGLFTPVSIILKVLGKDLLRKKMKQDDKTHWIERETQPMSMKNQF